MRRLAFPGSVLPSCGPICVLMASRKRGGPAQPPNSQPIYRQARHAEDPSTSGLQHSDARPVVLRYPAPLLLCELEKRYKRFLGDVRLPAASKAAAPRAAAAAALGADEPPVVVHVPNTGPMTGLLDALPAPALLSKAPPGAKRKYPLGLEWVWQGGGGGDGGTWVGVHSAKANAMARALLEAHLLDEGLPAYASVHPGGCGCLVWGGVYGWVAQ